MNYTILDQTGRGPIESFLMERYPQILRPGFRFFYASLDGAIPVVGEDDLRAHGSFIIPEDLSEKYQPRREIRAHFQYGLMHSPDESTPAYQSDQFSIWADRGKPHRVGAPAFEYRHPHDVNITTQVWANQGVVTKILVLESVLKEHYFPAVSLEILQDGSHQGTIGKFSSNVSGKFIQQAVPAQPTLQSTGTFPTLDSEYVLWQVAHLGFREIWQWAVQSRRYGTGLRDLRDLTQTVLWLGKKLLGTSTRREDIPIKTISKKITLVVQPSGFCQLGMTNETLCFTIRDGDVDRDQPFSIKSQFSQYEAYTEDRPDGTRIYHQKQTRHFHDGPETESCCSLNPAPVKNWVEGPCMSSTQKDFHWRFFVKDQCLSDIEFYARYPDAGSECLKFL